ncbi:hypothetical protein RND81_01G095800 [Saponaria officinalis]|uniref:LOB domain-containing protein n=1 Tax=Saponaria officinalis TaxID=3572 RepID=A0AAW1N6J2_SAPOF
MSCNGCRVLRKGCSETCIIRPCLQWIETAEAQAHATLFVAKFFGRADLMAFISAVPTHQRPALFQSLLFEACGRTVNPVNGAVGLLASGNWHICQAAVDTVMRGGNLRPIQTELLARALNAPPPRSTFSNVYGLQLMHPPTPSNVAEYMQGNEATSFGSELSDNVTNCFENCAENDRDGLVEQNRKLLNLFV